jgi:hypothetical protein
MLLYTILQDVLLEKSIFLNSGVKTSNLENSFCLFYDDVIVLFYRSCPAIAGCLVFHVLERVSKEAVISNRGLVPPCTESDHGKPQSE